MIPGKAGTVYSHTVIRVPGAGHEQEAPFVVLLVDLDDGRRVLGRFAGPIPPLLGGRVVEQSKQGETSVFMEEESSNHAIATNNTC